MDRLESLTQQLSQVTMYDIKSMYNQAKNMVLNVSEMEAKVNEATNDEAWGASSTLMQEIAQGTFNFQQFNEIMPCIYSKFMEKEARQWRQIYKALQLLEYIIKHGSERVVDDARSHISTIKMLRNFHYIDEKGKDQGINVRNRAKEIGELLGDLDRVRAERRKAKANRNKYTGTGNDPMSFSTSTGGRYGGFGSESLGNSGYGGGFDRDYGNYGGSSSSGGFRDESSRKPYEEYDAGDYEEPSHRRSESTSRATTSTRRTTEPAATKPAAPAPAPAKVVDLLGFGDDDVPAAPAVVASPPSKPLPPVSTAPSASLDDDFDDFQSAPSVAPAIQTAPVSAPAKANVFDLLGQTSVPAAAQSPPIAAMSPQQPAFAQSQSMFARPMMATSPAPAFGQMQPAIQPQSSSSVFTPAKPNYTTSSSSFGSTNNSASNPPPKPASSGNFDDLWTMGLGKAGATSTQANKGATNGAGATKSIRDLEKEKSQAAIWGSKSSGTANNNAFGAFGMGSASSSTPSGGADDLLL